MSSVSQLVSSIAQHKKFKRLAGYSISCLVKLIAPPAADWVNLCQEAARCGAVEAVGEVLTSPTTSDAAIFLHSAATVAAVATSSGRCAAAVAESPGLGPLLAAFVFYWDNTLPELARGSRGGELEGEDRTGARAGMKAMADLLLAVCKQAPQSVIKQPLGVPVLLRLAVPGFGCRGAVAEAGGLVVDLHPSAVAMQCFGLVGCLPCARACCESAGHPPLCSGWQGASAGVEAAASQLGRGEGGRGAPVRNTTPVPSCSQRPCRSFPLPSRPIPSPPLEQGPLRVATLSPLPVPSLCCARHCVAALRSMGHACLVGRVGRARAGCVLHRAPLPLCTTSPPGVCACVYARVCVTCVCRVRCVGGVALRRRQLARAKGALTTLASMPDVVTAVMDAGAFVARRSDSGLPGAAAECLRLADPTLRLLQRMSWDDVGLESLRL
jgi:hypothetical protein